MTLSWFRMYSRAVDDDKLRLLAFEDRWHFVALLCLKTQGIIDESNPDLRSRKIAIKLGLSGGELDEVKRRLMAVHLIDNDFQPKKWNQCQFKSDNSTERVKKYREKQQGAHKKRCGNVSETDQRQIQSKEQSKEKPICNRNGVTIPSVVDLYHTILCPPLPKVEKVTKTREGYIRQRIREDLTEMDYWRNYFEYVKQSDFLMGRAASTNGRPPFRADLEWLTKPANYAKVAEEKYHG